MVSFQPTEEQQLIRDTVAAFAREQIRPQAREADETGTIPGGLVAQGWELGLVQSPEESFRLADDDTVAPVTAAHREACATARAAVADLPLDAVVTGHRTGPRTLRWVYLQVLRELAHHCGHADILREQVLAD